MRCPYCQSDNTSVKDSRPAEDNSVIRRRRVCLDCGGRFTTHERVQLRELTVLKRSGKRVPFDRDKLTRSVMTALRKREVEPERVDRAISGVVRQLESLGETEIPTDEIGRHVMAALKRLDAVAYVRFASVYHNFQSAQDFGSFLNAMDADDGGDDLPDDVDDGEG
jgi:transcriptional repressor NrdR